MEECPDCSSSAAESQQSRPAQEDGEDVGVSSPSPQPLQIISAVGTL